MKKGRKGQGIELPFYKIHGAGNDLLVFQSKDLPLSTKAKAAFLRVMAHRRLGVGADQLVEVLSLKPPAIQIWNQDGSRAEMCANGGRSFLALAEREGWIRKQKRVSLVISGRPCVGLRGKHGFELGLDEPEIRGRSVLSVLGEKISYWNVSVGNPHAVIFATGGKGNWRPPKEFSHLVYGPLIESHKAFPRKTNVEFVRAIRTRGDEAEARVEVWERGSGPTLSCGSGAVAVARVLREILGVKKARILMNGFALLVRFEAGGAYLGGPVALKAKGVYFG